MYDKTIPESEETRFRRARTLTRLNSFLGIASFIVAVIAILLLIGVVVAVFVLEFTSADATLMFILIGAFAGGAIVFAFVAFGLMKQGQLTEKRRDDFLERCDSEESFFVGEGTLATFEEGALALHAEGKKAIRVPYAELRLFSVCTRKKPREQGEWSVVFEIPARYLAKEGRGAKKEPPVLIQADAKPRLYAVIAARGLTLLGELPPEGEVSKKAFCLRKKFFLPNRKKRNRALIFMIAGFVLLAVGIAVGILFDATVGAILGVFGAFFGGRSVWAFVRARAMLAFYDEGLFWRESDGQESVFLKWEELDSVAPAEHEGFALLTVQCPYGAYNFPRPAGVWEYLGEHFPEKVK